MPLSRRTWQGFKKGSIFITTAVTHQAGQLILIPATAVFTGEYIKQSCAFTLTQSCFSRRLREVCNSVGRELPSLRAKRPYNPAYMHPDDLSELGLVDGQSVEIESSRARVRAIVAASEDVRRGVVSMAHAWGAAPGEDADVEACGTSTARLIDVEREFDPISGMPRQSAIPVNVRGLQDA